MGLVNEAKPRTQELARKLLDKNQTALRAAKVAF